jgi:hypothetical protein
MPKAAFKIRPETPTPPKRRKPSKGILDDLIHPQARRHEQISRRAFEIYLEEGSVEGRNLDHWLRAEYEIEGEAPEIK